MTARPDEGDRPEAPAHANVIAPPPLIFLGSCLLGLALDRLVPGRLPRLPRTSATRLAGGGLVAAGVGLGLWAATAFRRAGTPIEPHRPARRLLTTGPYRYSRNPMYLAMTAVSAGVSLLLARLGPLGVLPLALLVVRRGVVEREERYLAWRFGDDYRAYAARVGRWL